MTLNILWANILRDPDALFEGTQARNQRADSEESLGSASREGRARRRRRLPDEGCRAHPWRVLRPLRFAGSAGDRGFCRCDGSVDGALAQAGRTDAAGKAAGDDRGDLSDAAASRRSRSWLRCSDEILGAGREALLGRTAPPKSRAKKSRPKKAATSARH